MPTFNHLPQCRAIPCNFYTTYDTAQPRYRAHCYVLRDSWQATGYKRYRELQKAPGNLQLPAQLHETYFTDQQAKQLDCGGRTASAGLVALQLQAALPAQLGIGLTSLS